MHNQQKKIRPSHIEYLAKWFGYYAKGVDSHVEEDNERISLVFTKPGWSHYDNVALIFRKDEEYARIEAWKARPLSDGGPILACMDVTGMKLWRVKEALAFAIRVHLLVTSA